MTMPTCTPECTLLHHSTSCVARSPLRVYQHLLELEKIRRLIDFYQSQELSLPSKSVDAVMRANLFGVGVDTAYANNMRLHGGNNIGRTVSYEMSFGVSAPPPEMIGRFLPINDNSAAAIADIPIADIPMPMKKPERDEILRREPICAEDVPADVDAMQADLAMEAEKLLGYSVMRTRLKLQAPFLAALAQLEIEPYDPASVEQYKREMLGYAQNEARRMDIAEGIDPYSLRARLASWRRHPLNGYGKPVPEYALDKALQIKRACPNAEFEIEELTVIPDPFLVVKHGRQRLYIEVWDEPMFEAKNLRVHEDDSPNG